MSRAQDSKLEYNWKDIQEAQKTGFEECKKKVLSLLSKYKDGGDLDLVYKYDLLSSLEDKIEKL